ncbi:sarcosine oxidase subunit beta family protein [Limobrevibacterium gyesilva]|uniref:Sarcosine oxidase subunit beta n=1 Tax=Limobrevibacterium gyesilva TaxID=2991712 RepID=A0AA42CGW0_9PROT|nr:sarcosine oxidase subunit beta family protein [Limobrevibacterium gyesilva]MCW3474377.1 sarcosine oxidase subunit beta family protein [Limobrevibacterium gyesilva]
MRYSFLQLLKQGLSGQTGWPPAWRSPEPKRSYDAVIVGGGGHGLAAAYYLARVHGMRRVAVLERGWLGGGNTGRNTTIVRSNYFFPESARIYDFALRLYEGLSKELNFNIMLSQRGVLNLAHSEHDMELMARSVNAMLVNGIAVELLDAKQVRAEVPLLNFGPGARYPIHGGFVQRRGGIARHDAVAWGYARGADSLGVDIIQNCEVTGFRIEGGRVQGIETSRGAIAAGAVGLSVAGHSGVLAGLAGFRLPIQSYALQAMVSEPLKPMLNTVVMSPATGMYVSQSDKGELVFGGGLDLYPSYAQRGNLPVEQTVVAGLLEMFPAFRRLKLLRQWAGIVDVCWDYSPIIGPAPVDGMYLNCGWGTGGFKAIPAGGWLMAHLLATGRHHDISAPFDLSRFTTGRLIDEAAGAAIAH